MWEVFKVWSKEMKQIGLNQSVEHCHIKVRICINLTKNTWRPAKMASLRIWKGKFILYDDLKNILNTRWKKQARLYLTVLSFDSNISFALLTDRSGSSLEPAVVVHSSYWRMLLKKAPIIKLKIKKMHVVWPYFCSHYPIWWYVSRSREAGK